MDKEDLIKRLSDLQGMDINEIRNGNELLKYFSGKNMEYFATFKMDQRVALEVAQNALKDYENFKGRIKIIDPELNMMVESVVACWHLAIIKISLLTDRIRCDEVDLVKLKKLLIAAFPSQNISVIFRMILLYICPIFLENHFFGVAKALHVLFLEADKLLKDKPSGENVLELYYLTKMFSLSSAALNRANSHNSSNAAKEKIFETIADELSIEDPLKFPAMIKTFDDAKKMFAYLLPKLQRYEQKNQNISERSVEFLNTKFWHGLAYHELSMFQKSDPAQESKLAQKSVEYWKPLLDKHLRMQDLKVHTKMENREVLAMYVQLWDKQSMNYESILDFKAKAILHLDYVQAKAFILELNKIRSDYISFMKDFEKYTETCPENFDVMTLSQLFFTTAIQMRLMIFEDKRQQKKILDESIEYVQKHYQQEKKRHKSDNPPGYDPKMEELSEMMKGHGIKKTKKEYEEMVIKLKSQDSQKGMMKMIQNAMSMPDNFMIQNLVANMDTKPFIRKFRRN